MSNYRAAVEILVSEGYNRARAAQYACAMALDGTIGSFIQGYEPCGSKCLNDYGHCIMGCNCPDGCCT